MHVVVSGRHILGTYHRTSSLPSKGKLLYNTWQRAPFNFNEFHCLVSAKYQKNKNCHKLPDYLARECILIVLIKRGCTFSKESKLPDFPILPT